MRINKIILFLILSICFINVSALEVGDNVGRLSYRDSNGNIIRTNVGAFGHKSDGTANGFNYRRYSVNYNGIYNEVMCIAPGFTDPEEPLKVKNIYEREDVLMASIIDGIDEVIKSNITSNTAEEYAASTLATRAFVYMFSNNSTKTIYKMEKPSNPSDGYRSVVIFFREMAKKYPSLIKGATGASTINGINNSYTDKFTSASNKQNYREIAEKKFLAGLNRAINTRKNYENNLLSINSSSVKSSDDGNKKEVIFEVNIPDYHEDIYFKLKCDECEDNVDYTSEIYESNSKDGDYNLISYNNGINLGKTKKTTYFKVVLSKINPSSCPSVKLSSTLNVSSGLVLLEYTAGSSTSSVSEKKYYQEYVCEESGKLEKVFMEYVEGDSINKYKASECKKPGDTVYSKPECISCAKGGEKYAPSCSSPRNNTCDKWRFAKSKCSYDSVTFTKGELTAVKGKTGECKTKSDIGNKRYEEMNSYVTTTTSSRQHFISMFKTEVGDMKLLEKELEINFCDDCSLLLKACKESLDSESDVCKKYNDKCKNDCTALVGNNDCNSSDQTFSIKEGLKINNNNCPAKSDKTNVKECIIGKNDNVGNSYQATTSDDNGVKYPNNSYCKVYCNEEYDFNMPGVQSTESGRNIELNMSVKGKKSCYTAINVDLFKDDLKNTMTKLADYYSNYEYWKGAKDAIGDMTHTEGSVVRECQAPSKYLNDFLKFDYNSVTYSISNEGILTNFKKRTVSSTLSDQGYGGMVCCDDEDEGTGCECCESAYNADLTRIINENYNKFKTLLLETIEKYKQIVYDYNSCSSNTNNVDLFKATKLWDTSYKYNPKFSYWYEDKYMGIAKNVYLDEYDKNITSTKYEICSGEVDNEFNTCSSGWTSKSTLIDTSVIGCTTSGEISCYQINLPLSNTKYVKESKNASSNYKLPTQFYTLYPSGKLLTESNEWTTSLYNKLPISLNESKGVYNYSIYAEDLGEYYNDDKKVGRIWGAKNSLFKKVQSDSSVCKTEGAMNNKDAQGKPAYSCVYKVNCNECIVNCSSESCKWEGCLSGECKTCENCIFNNKDVNFIYRPINNNVINPNDRKLGVNWNYPENNISTKTQMKACTVTNDILTKGNKVYETDSEDNVLKVNLTQSMIRDINEYNKKYEDNGGFANETLECYPYKYNGNTYNNVYCYSTFIDEMINIDGGKYKDNFIFNNDRLDNKNKRKNTTNQCSSDNCYWTEWNKEIKSNSVSVYTCMKKARGNNFEFSNYDDKIGPSYR